MGAGTTSRDAGDSRGLLLCTAFAAGEALAAEPSGRDDRARQGADGCRRLRELPYRRSGKTVRRGQADRYPVRRHLFAQPDAGPRYRPRRAGATTSFYRALRFGVAPDGSRYYPAFPYPNFTKLIRDDILAIRAYLATLTPVRNTPPPPELRWPLQLSRRHARLELAVLQARHSDAGPAEERGMESRPLSGRGRRRIAAPATRRRTCLAPTDAARPSAAGCVQGMFAPRLDGAERSGLKSWSVDDIAEYLQSGRNGQQPCRRTDVGGRGQLDLEDERCGCPRDRGLPEGPAGRRAGAGRSPAAAGANGRRRKTLRRRLHRLP